MLDTCSGLRIKYDSACIRSACGFAASNVALGGEPGRDGERSRTREECFARRSPVLAPTFTATEMWEVCMVDLSRGQALAIGGASLLSGLLMGGGASAETGDTSTIAFNVNLPAFDPTGGPSSVNPTIQAIYRAIFDQYIGQNTDLSLTPGLLTKWGWNEDKTKAWMDVREGVVWQDGSPFGRPAADAGDQSVSRKGARRWMEIRAPQFVSRASHDFGPAQSCRHGGDHAHQGRRHRVRAVARRPRRSDRDDDLPG